MKSSVQQYIGLILTLCMILFCVVGIVSDGFTDFEFVKPKAVASAEAEDVEQDSSATTATKVLGGYAEGEKITWENERVEFSIDRVEDNSVVDSSFELSDEGYLTFNNKSFWQDKFSNMIEGEYYQFKLSNNYDDYPAFYDKYFDYTFRIDEEYLDGFDIVRLLCKNIIYAGGFTDSEIIIERVYPRTDYNSYSTIFTYKSKFSLRYVDRFHAAPYSKPDIADGYVFDGWYKDVELSEYYSDKDEIRYQGAKLFWYTDEVYYPKVSKAVMLTNSYHSHIENSFLVAEGTTYTYLMSDDSPNSISKAKLKKLFDSYMQSSTDYQYRLIFSDGQELVCGVPSTLVINEDVSYYSTSFCLLEFYNDDELFYTMTVDYGSQIEDMSAIPTPPKKPNYQFEGWYYLNEDGEAVDFVNSNINSNYVLYAKYGPDQNIYTLTYDFNGYVSASGATCIVVHSKADVYNIPYSLSKWGKYKHVGWCYEDGREFLGRIYEDTIVYAKWVRDVVTFNFYECGSHAFLKSLTFDYGDIPDFEKETADLQREHYTMSFKRYEGYNTHYDFDIADVSEFKYGASLCCIYTPIEYTVNFYSDYEIFESASYTIEQVFVLPSPVVVEGYDFVGWTFKDDSIYDSDKAYLKDMELYAKYVIQKKTVTLMIGDIKKWSFVVDYGTPLNEVFDTIDKKNYNVVSFDSSNLKDDCFVGDVVFEVAEMAQTDKVKNVVKNNWRYIAIALGGVILLVGIVNMFPKSRRKRR